MDIGDMDLNGRDPHRRDRIPQCDAGMCITGCVNDNYIDPSPRFLDPINELPFRVRLSELNFSTQFLGLLPYLVLDGGQSRPPVDFRLALAEQVQIRSIQE